MPTLQLVNLGTTTNDGTGDSLPIGGAKINTNFQALWGPVFTDIPAAISNLQATDAARSPANPTASVGLSVANGVATTYLRSDAAPALSVAIVPTWTGVHTFNLPPVLKAATAALPTHVLVTAGDPNLAPLAVGSVTLQALAAGIGQPQPGNPTASVGLAAVNGVATSYLRSDAAPALSVAIVPTWTGVHTFNLPPVLKATTTAVPTHVLVTTADPNATGRAVSSIATSAFLMSSGNLGDLANPGTARMNLGVNYTFATGTPISAAGDTSLVLAASSALATFRYAVSPGAAGAYTRTISVSSSGAAQGAQVRILLDLPAAVGANVPTIEVRSSSATGPLLHSCTAGLVARTEVVELYYVPTDFYLKSAGTEPHAGDDRLTEVINTHVPAGSIKWDGLDNKMAEAAIRGAAIGTGDYTVATTVTLSSPGVNSSALFSLDGTSGGGGVAQAAGGIYVYLSTGGYNLSYAVRNSAGAGSVSGGTLSLSALAGRTVEVALVRRSGVCTLYLNGKPQTALTPPATQAEPMIGDPLYLRLGSLSATNGSYPGRIYNARVYNRALSGAELRDLALRGVAIEDRNASGPVISDTVLNGGFETAGSPFANWVQSVAGTSTANRDISVFNSGGASCRLDMDASNSAASLTQSVVESGRNYRISGWLKSSIPAGATTLQYDLNDTNFVATYTLPTPVQDWTYFSFERVSGNRVATAGSFSLSRASGVDASQSRWFDGITLQRIGCLVDLDLGMGSGYVLPDMQNRFPLVVNSAAYGNFQHTRQSMSGRFQGWVGTASPTLIGGLPANARIMAVVFIPAAPVTVRMGYASGTAEFITAGTPLELGRNEPPLKTRYTGANGQIWVQLSAAVATDIVVIYDILPGLTTAGAGDNLPMGEQWAFLEAINPVDQVLPAATDTVVNLTQNNVLVGNGLTRSGNDIIATRSGRIEFTVKAQVQHTTASNVKFWLTRKIGAAAATQLDFSGFASNGSGGQDRPCHISYTLQSNATVAVPETYQIHCQADVTGVTLNADTPVPSVSAVTAQIALYKN